MLHSYWFTEAGKVFEAVLRAGSELRDRLLGTRRQSARQSRSSARPSAKDAQTAWEALEKARAIGAKTQRERDWIEAMSAYYRDHDKVPVDDRLTRLHQGDGADDAALP